MSDAKKTKAQLVAELETLRCRMAQMEKSEAERQRAEKKVLETKEYYENLVGNSGDVILSTTPEGVVTSWNGGAQKLYGYTKEEVLGKDVRDLIGPRHRLGEITQLIDGAASGKDLIMVETVRLRKDGSPVEVEVTNSPVRDSQGNLIGVSGIHKDISERKRLEREVLEAKEYLENLLVTAEDAVICADQGGMVTVWNPAAERLYGYAREEVLGKPYVSFHVPEEKKKEVEEVQRSLEQGKTKQDYETQRRRKDGLLVWVSISLAPLLDKNGRYTGAISIHKDITERKRAEGEIRRVSEYFQNLVGSAGDGIIATDSELKVTVWNSGAEQIYGYSREETLGQPIAALIGGPDKGDEVIERARSSLDGQLQGPYEANRYRKDGSAVWLSMTTSPLHGVDGKLIGVLTIHKDITEDKQIREQLVHSERMSSLGELISGVAHELNNPLTSVIGFSQLSLLRNELSPKVRANLERIVSEADRAARIVQNLLRFARQDKPEKQKASINSLLRQTVDLRAHQVKVNNIRVVEKLGDGLPHTVADPLQLQQVFLNLINNAEQAMVEAYGGGTLTIRTSQRTTASRRPWIRVEIKDDGPGISENHLSRIFDPFFTTKPVGKGTGLGLSTCYGIISGHGGHISVKSTPGNGAKFIIDLPVLQEQTKTTEHNRPREMARPFGKSLLVVDDEQVLLEMFSEVLRDLGHEVTTAASGRSAVSVLEDRDYDLIIVDYKMPDIGGKEVYLWLNEQKPHLAGRVLIMTGDTASRETQAFLMETGLPSLAKPFSIENARALISRLLKSGTGDSL